MADYHVIEARYVRDYVLWLRFRDGKAGEIDLAPVLYGPVFEPLRAIEQFRRFFVHPDCATIAWPNNADIAPEYLHENVRIAETPIGAGPPISTFFGITICMYFTDHGRPHFHATYAGDEASVDIATGDFRGDLPRTAQRLIREWLELHRNELLANWERARQHMPLVPIEPLS